MPAYSLNDKVKVVGPVGGGREGYADGYRLGVEGFVVKPLTNGLVQIKADNLRPYWIATEHLELVQTAPATEAK